MLISGFGSNLQAIIDATTRQPSTAFATDQSTPLECRRLENTKIALVVSNKSSAYGLQRAKDAGIPTLVFPFKPYRDAGKSRAEYDADLAAAIHAHFINASSRLQSETEQYPGKSSPSSPDLLVLAGFMHILSAEFIAQFPCGIINLHPA